MSIFSILRYPISSPPKGEELAALPPELFTQWIQSSDWKVVTSAHDDYQHIADWYKDNWVWMTIDQREKYKKDIKDLETLKQLIHDWDEEV